MAYVSAIKLLWPYSVSLQNFLLAFFIDTFLKREYNIFINEVMSLNNTQASQTCKKVKLNYRCKLAFLFVELLLNRP